MPSQLGALITAFSYAVCLVSVRRGLRYSTPMTATYVAVMINTVALWAAVFLTGGIPSVSPVAAVLFALAGIIQVGTRIFAYTGIDKIGASRSSTVQATSPLFSAFIAIAFLNETASLAVLLGTLLVVAGIIFICWKPEEQLPDYRWWHLLFPLAASLSSGINHPIRRYALTLSNEPLFFAALMGVAAAVVLSGYLVLPTTRPPLAWDCRALPPFVITGVFETIGILSLIIALSLGPVVVVAPITATYPLWIFLWTVFFARDIEKVNARTFMASLFVLAGIVALYVAH